jgi:formylglycine-generating enzyme required for sulfatase activity
MQAQEAWIYGYDQITNQDYGYEMTWNEPEYSFNGYLGGYASFYLNDDPNLGAYDGDLSYPGGNIFESMDQNAIPWGLYMVILNTVTGDYAFVSSSNCVNPSDVVDIVIGDDNASSTFCEGAALFADIAINGEYANGYMTGLEYQWFSNGNPIPDADNYFLYLNASALGPQVIQLVATCPNNNETYYSNEIVVPACYNDFTSPLNYLLVQNVTTTGNIPGQSIQVQFDLNWGNTWKDDVNWDAVWVFMKYKDAQGIWKHCKVSPTGYDHGQGTPNIIEPTADQMGAFVRLSAEGQGDFNVDAMQLRWNYGADGLSSVSGLEVRVYAIEMVYTPQGDFSMSAGPTAPGGKIPVINTRMSPVLSVDNDASIRIKGDAGLDTDANGIVENTTYPTGYYPFYMFKYEMSEQQYADFLNCLTPTQRSTLGVAGATITQTAGQYFASLPNQVCAGANADRVLAYADWAGLRPMSYLEYQKALNGPRASNPNGQMYGIKNLGASLREPYVNINSAQFNRTNHGNGVLGLDGLSNVAGWSASEMGTILGYECYGAGCPTSGFRLCRTAE